MNISASIKNSHNQHQVTVQTNDVSKVVAILPKPDGYGSSINGGELLLLALATCFCNDLYREANRRKIPIESVEVECTGEFDAEGEPGSNFRYSAHIVSDAPSEVINDLIQHTDKVAEIQNTLRKGLNVKLNSPSNFHI